MHIKAYNRVANKKTKLKIVKASFSVFCFSRICGRKANDIELVTIKAINE